MEKKNYPEITYLRGMAILMVLLYHSIIVYPIDLRADAIWGGIAESMWYVQMPLFFLVSGFCFREDGHYGRYVWKKCRRILIPHVLFGMIDLAFRVLPAYIPALSGLVNQQTGLGEGIVDFLLYGGEDPFLRSLFMILVVFPWLHRCMERFWWSRIGIYGAAVAMYLFWEDLPSLMALSYSGRFLIFFCIGYELRRHHWERIKEKAVSPWFAALSLACCVLASYCYCNYGYGKYITVIIALTGAWFLLNAVSILKSFWAGFAQLAGSYSLPLYLMDGYALVVTRTVFVSRLGVTQPLLIVLLNFVVDTAVLMVVTHWIIARVRPLCFLFGLPYRKRVRDK